MTVLNRLRRVDDGRNSVNSCQEGDYGDNTIAAPERETSASDTDPQQILMARFPDNQHCLLNYTSLDTTVLIKHFFPIDTVATWNGKI